MRKTHNSAPLPFQGQKRNFVKDFKVALKTYPNDAVYVDLFGGSGLLSHVVKQEKPNAKVIYNDYDNFKKRLEAIPTTNEIIAKIRPILNDIPKKGKIPPLIKNKVLKLIKSYENQGYVDFITLSSSILFSMKYVITFKELEKETFYNNLKKNEYNAGNYLEGVEFTKSDYKTLFERYKNLSNVVFLVDPPYLSTDCKTYKNYWKLSDYLDVLKVLIDTKYFYFTSDKSSIIELCEWVESNTGGLNPFNNAKIKYHYTVVTKKSGYKDVMLYKGYNTTKTF
ncbi:DNA methyltransferase [Tenacibaculum sp. 190524A02b]|uniref:DNA methyltransferase n=1 Tax=Tenacibaculum vairaonense TaxID=3137860 RepID=A0ABP1FJ19_9FLAO